MKRIIYLTSSLFPEGQAYSTRIVGFIKMFESLGISVHVIADNTKCDNVIRGTKYPFLSSTYEIIGKSGRIYRFLFNKRCAVDALKKAISQDHIDAVISNADSDRFKEYRKICTAYNIPLYLEICEWLDITSFKLRRLDYRYYRMNRMICNEYKNADGIIAISNLLKEHFTKQGVNTIRIPTVIDVSNIPHDDKRDKSKFVLVHIGTAVVHKEKFRNIMLAITNINSNIPIEYRIYGSSYETVLANIGGDENLLHKMGDRLKIMGIIPHKDVYNAYHEADFSIFIRDNKLSSNAGFPTKLAESMAAGVPVISNDTGDVGLYLHTEKSGYLIKDNSVEEIEAAIRAALSLTDEQKKLMRKNARYVAENSFDYSVYCETLMRFMKGE